MAELSALAEPAFERFDGAAVWEQLDDSDRNRIGAAALELALTRYLGDRVYEDRLPQAFERIARAAEREIGRELHAAIVEALSATAFEAANGRTPRVPTMLGGIAAFEAADGCTPRVPSLLGGICRRCACTQNDACPGGCGWAAEDLCTACVTPEEEQAGG